MQGEVRFLRVADSAVKRWSKPKRFDFLHRLPAAPIADTELLHLSHYCPVVIGLTADGPRVRILLDPQMVVAAPVDKNGRWRPGYSPIALRTLPFWPGEESAEIQIAPELFAVSDNDGFSFCDRSGRPSEQFAVMIASIDRLRQGMQRLDQAAKLLLAVELLTPLVVNRSGELPAEIEYFSVSIEKFRSLAATQVAVLSADHCLSLDLAVACMFSRRLLARHVGLRADKSIDRGPEEKAPGLWNDIVEPFEMNLKLDTTQLFSFEQFRRAESASSSKARNYVD
jgi:hypothetical protein